ncbi:MAG TPA: glycosyltransferase family 4 protein, partial [Verrucomicrobiae bacterium]
WLALPHEVAAWYREQQVTQAVQHSSPYTQPLKGKNGAVVLYSYYASDPRPRRETEALQRAGMNVDVICLRQDANEPRVEMIDGVRVHRVPMKRRRAGKFTYALQYAGFLLSTFFTLSWWRLRRRIDLVHVHNMPDFLVFSALLPKWLGGRVILDLHDPMPELLVTIFGLKEHSFGVRLLKFMEKQSVQFADHVLTVNRACEQIFSARSCAPQKIQVLMNVPDERVFQFRDCRDYPPRSPEKPFVIMFHGSIVERNGLDIAVEALRLLRPRVPTAELWIYGATTPFLQKVLDPASLNGLGSAVRHLGPKKQPEIVAAIHACDVGVIPNRNNAFTEINTPTRIFEYLSVGKPVVSPRAKGITDYFGPEDMVYFELGDAADLARQLEFVYHHPERVQEITRRGQEIYRRESWSYAGRKFIQRVTELLHRHGEAKQ